MLRRFMPFAVTAALFCPLAAFAQTPPAAVPAPPVAAAPAPTDPTAPLPKKHNHVGGKISAIDTAAKTITLTHGKKTVVLSVPDTAKIYKIGDAKGEPTGTFADLVLDTPINATTDGDETAPVAKTVHIRAPKNAVPAAAPATTTTAPATP